ELLVPLNYEVAVDFSPVSAFDKAPGCSFTGEIISTYNNGADGRVWYETVTKKRMVRKPFKETVTKTVEKNVFVDVLKNNYLCPSEKEIKESSK
ncbi:MAG: hypothetical protein ACK5HT_03750, partial [Draconibacterium sp.]